ncbi:hypothetical protein VM1G_11286 [Cytospora mali]|uniref:Uncharacterized protein n=1 Tax=Cytospora mali TaxID=578113 RepID=A0A194VMS9_CYTMA|nr:hypothetical protein VM1G_11286 [Valsa mali]
MTKYQDDENDEMPLQDQPFAYLDGNGNGGTRRVSRQPMDGDIAKVPRIRVGRYVASADADRSRHWSKGIELSTCGV